jgi:C-terminal processing protease CtpA/Prc
MRPSYRITLILTVLVLISLSCKAVSNISGNDLPPAQSTATLLPTPSPLPPIPVEPGNSNPNEPVRIYGDIPYTSPFFIDSLGEPYVMLEDQAGFVSRNLDFEFPIDSQIFGPVTIHPDQTLTYELSLPSVPQGTQVDVDQNGKQDKGVQVFAVSYWSNTWGDPFLEKRDGTGWSNASTSTIVDPDRNNEIVGGTLVVWAPDDAQQFPTGFGPDKMLFTADDPVAPIPAGYNLVDLNQEPFRNYKEAQADLTLAEGIAALNDYSHESYSQAFESLFDKVSREYPFTKEKGLDWQAIYAKYQPDIANARNDEDFYRGLKAFANAIPDGHVGLSYDPQLFYELHGGGLGMLVDELSDGRVIVTDVIPNQAADKAGIQVGAEISQWDDAPIIDAISKVQPYTSPFSTDHAKRINQVRFLTRLPLNTRVKVTFQNPGESNPQTTTLKAGDEFDTLSIIFGNQDEIALPIQGEVLDDSGLGYIKINSFLGDYHLLAKLWEYYIKGLIDNNVPGLIIDLRENGGGYGGLAFDFADYLFDQGFDVYTSSHYNNLTGGFTQDGKTSRIEPGPLYYDGPIAVLVGPDCVSACEGFAYALQQNGRSMIIGQYPTAGAFGSVGLGQFALPGGISMQFPFGRPETPDGKLLIEGTGVIPDITVPVDYESAIGNQDTVLQAGIQALQNKLK